MLYTLFFRGMQFDAIAFAQLTPAQPAHIVFWGEKEFPIEGLFILKDAPRGPASAIRNFDFNALASTTSWRSAMRRGRR